MKKGKKVKKFSKREDYTVVHITELPAASIMAIFEREEKLRCIESKAFTESMKAITGGNGFVIANSK
jgi:hypothetical protein